MTEKSERVAVQKKSSGAHVSLSKNFISSSTHSTQCTARLVGVIFTSDLKVRRGESCTFIFFAGSRFFDSTPRAIVLQRVICVIIQKSSGLKQEKELRVRAVWCSWKGENRVLTRRAFPAPLCAEICLLAREQLLWSISNYDRESAPNGIIVERATERAAPAFVKYAAVSTDVLNKKPISRCSLARSLSLLSQRDLYHSDRRVDGRTGTWRWWWVFN